MELALFGLIGGGTAFAVALFVYASRGPREPKE
jgi:hypothetical protein